MRSPTRRQLWQYKCYMNEMPTFNGEKNSDKNVWKNVSFENQIGNDMPQFQSIETSKQQYLLLRNKHKNQYMFLYRHYVIFIYLFSFIFFLIVSWYICTCIEQEIYLLFTFYFSYIVLPVTIKFGIMCIEYNWLHDSSLSIIKLHVLPSWVMICSRQDCTLNMQLLHLIQGWISIEWNYITDLSKISNLSATANL